MSVILIETDSKVLLNDELAKIIKKSTNKVTYNYKEYSLEDIIVEATYMSMFQEMKYIIIKNATFFGKDKLNDKENKMFEDYLNHQNPYTTLIFTTYDVVDKRKSLTKKIIEKEKFISLKAYKGYELINQTINLVKRKGYKIDYDLAKVLIDCCLGNWDIINSEVSKFELIYDKGKTLLSKDILSVVSNNTKDNNYKFIQAVVDKDMSKSYELLHDLMILKVEPLYLFNMLAREFRLMLMYKILSNKKMSNKDLMQVLNVADWQLDKIFKNSCNYHEDDLSSNLVILSKLDYKIKSGNIDKFEALNLFLLEQFEY